MESRLVCLFYIYRLAESVDSTVGRFNLHGIVFENVSDFSLLFALQSANGCSYILSVVASTFVCPMTTSAPGAPDQPTGSLMRGKSSCLLYSFELHGPENTYAMGILFSMYYIKGCNIYSLYFCRSHMLTSPYIFSQPKCYSKISPMPLMTIQR